MARARALRAQGWVPRRPLWLDIGIPLAALFAGFGVGVLV
jgi:hypothetical protein